MICENSTHGTGRIVNPRCWKGKAAKLVTVAYSEVEWDMLYLCAECTKYVKKDARRHGYSVSVKNI